MISLPFRSSAFQDDFLRPQDNRREPGNAQATFILQLFAFRFGNFRIDDRNELVSLFASARIRHHDALAHSNLRCRKADTRSLVHGFHHVLHELNFGV